jgi:predicted transposase/invertase (TIGR01784 family)
LLERPRELQERIFERVFKIAEISMLSEVEHLEYEESLNALWDITNAMEDSEKKGFFKGKEEGEKLGLEKGRAEGRANAMREIARTMKQHGDDINYIVSVTGLTKDEILRNG